MKENKDNKTKVEVTVKLDACAKILCLACAVLIISKARTDWQDHTYWVNIRKSPNYNR